MESYTEVAQCTLEDLKCPSSKQSAVAIDELAMATEVPLPENDVIADGPDAGDNAGGALSDELVGGEDDIQHSPEHAVGSEADIQHSPEHAIGSEAMISASVVAARAEPFREAIASSGATMPARVNAASRGFLSRQWQRGSNTIRKFFAAIVRSNVRCRRCV